MSPVEPRSSMSLAREVIERDLSDPLWPCLTEGDWDRDAKALARAVIALRRDNARMKRAIENHLSAYAASDEMSDGDAELARAVGAIQK